MDAMLWNIGVKVTDVRAEADFYVALGGRLLLHEFLPTPAGEVEYALVEFGGTRLFLGTNTMLAPAIHLYEDAGFVRITRDRLPVADYYARADILMELK